MRIDKINENQIRCYLSREEMQQRKIHLKELAYGTEKAKKLFHEMMQEAYARFGFTTDNMPVMIEAVPLHDDSLVLTVTKVENPEELDTRFSSFAPFVRSGDDEASPYPSPLGQLLDSIRQGLVGNSVKSGLPGGKKEGAADKTERTGTDVPNAGTSNEGVRNADIQNADLRDTPPAAGTVDRLPAGGLQLYTFPSLGKAADAAVLAAPGFRGKSSLYRDAAESRYYLFLTPEQGSPAADYNSVLTVLSEFGTSESITPAREQHLREHCVVLCAADAIQRLARLAAEEGTEEGF